MALSDLRRTVRDTVFGLRRALAFSLRQPAWFLMRIFPSSASLFQSLQWLWQPVYGSGWHRRFYERDADPYKFDTSPYEKGKYEQTLAFLSGQRYGRALEIGCSQGAFTQSLAGICDNVLAIDICERALERARSRLKDHPNVTFRRAMLPLQFPEGQYDLIVCSDVLCFFSEDILKWLGPRFRSALRPGGKLFALHYLGSFGQALNGREVHDILQQIPGLDSIHDETVAGVGPGGSGYRITFFQLLPGAETAEARPPASAFAGLARWERAGAAE